MSESLELLNNVVEDILTSYEAKIENIDSFFETTQLILNEFQEPLLDTKQERGHINSQLEDLLAENEHLRRTDFNRMMQGLLSIQDEKEKEIKNLVNSYLTEQKQTIGILKENLFKIKEALAKGEGICVRESQELIGEVLAQQDKTKQDIITKLKEFQKEQCQMTQRLLELIAKGRDLRIKDLKSMLKEFQRQHKERKAQREERRREVRGRKEKVKQMLLEFKKKRAKPKLL